jgi:Putative neutral zinc metallopeptidase
MRWTPGGRGDIEDMRGRSGGFGVARLGIGGFLVLLVLSWLTGTNLFSLLGTGDIAPSQSVGTSGEPRSSPAEERMVDFVNAVTKDAQDTWAEILGSRYERTRVVLFRNAIESACGFAQAATGPFYCPGDKKVYLDLRRSSAENGDRTRHARALHPRDIGAANSVVQAGDGFRGSARLFFTTVHQLLGTTATGVVSVRRRARECGRRRPSADRC